MANRIPLIVDTLDSNKLKELPVGDNLDLGGAGITNAGTVNATDIRINNVSFNEPIFAGEIISFVNCALLAHINNASDLEDISSSLLFNNTDRISSDIEVPPGSLRNRVSKLNDFSFSTSIFACVDFPDPSIPSNVIKWFLVKINIFIVLTYK